jgi:hypothetical protein
MNKIQKLESADRLRKTAGIEEECIKALVDIMAQIVIMIATMAHSFDWECAHFI